MGAVVGRLRINGNPNVTNGDIKLSLRERDSPVEIAPGSKDLVLKTALDKEGLHGPASVYVNVICDRGRSTDPVSDLLHFQWKAKVLTCLYNLITKLSLIRCRVS